MSYLVLYIEDNPDNLTLVQRAIEAAGYEFRGKMTGEDGLVAAGELQPDLILLDINLPDIDGYEVARRLRASGDEHLMHVPVIAITANALRGDAEKAIASGCDVYMSKPINIRELWARVGALLQSSNT
jgi:CheY-like chemotaxis protein